jgi:SAM-dependent methyltransferase
MTNRESALAHRLLDKFEGVEIGGNSFGLKTRKLAASDRLPLEDSSVDFVVSAHEIERSLDPIKTLKEWYRVVRSGGYVYVIASHKEQAWAAKDFAELVNELGWTMVAVQDVDDKDGSGFAVVIKVEKEAVAQMDSITSSTQVPAIRPDRRMSMTFLLAPTAPIRTAGSASVLEYARRFQERGHDVSITTWPKFVWQEEEPFPGFGSNLPIH